LSDIRIGVDTGGTFTDLVLIDGAAGRRTVHKLPTTPDDPARGILAGVAEILEKAGATASDIGFLVHGTTLATNAVLTGRTAKTGMITTRGFRDILVIGRQRRPSFYDLRVEKPTPPAARDRIFEVDERLDERGNIIIPLDEAGVRAAVAALKAAGVEALSICFMHAYANPDHERRAKAIVEAEWPEAHLSVASDILREFREFERFSTATVNAGLLPLIDAYLRRFEAGLRDLGVGARPLVMQSNGGAVSTEAVRSAPINTFFSGPAGGVIATAALGRGLGIGDMISFDMGGTSTDVCLVKQGAPATRNLREIAGFPVRIPTLDLHTIGAGGGSIAWIDPGGLLKVGPASAGADPGPALYGRGGAAPTVTDANVVLGRLAGEALIGGAMTVYPEKAKAAVEALGREIGLDAIETASGIVEIVNANMMGAVRVVSIEKGEDPRDYALVAFGGAGPLHAAEIAAAMESTRVIVPNRPGILSAEGLLDADRRGDFGVTCLVLAEPDNISALIDAKEILMDRGDGWRRAEGLDAAETAREWRVDLRYAGQAFELAIPISEDGFLAEGLTDTAARFHQRHEEVNGYRMATQAIEVVNLRLAVVVPRAAAAGREAATPADTESRRRPVWFRETGFAETEIFSRNGLVPGTEISGPAIIEQMDSTTVVPPGWRVSVGADGSLDLLHYERVR